MLNLAILLPLAFGVIVLLLPATRGSTIRWTALLGSCAALVSSIALWAGFDTDTGASLQWRTTLAWIPAIGASYDVAVDGLSLALIVLTHVLLVATMLYVLPNHHRTKAHAFLFLLMATGLAGVFAARDLLLFYLFFEVALVPLYFVIGIWGHERRRYAAIKFFLYTRAGSLAMLLSFLGLYLGMEPHTFSLPEIIATQPLAGRPEIAALVLLGLVIGFGVKLPILPLHNWLPDAHVEAPTEGSVMLAGIQLKLGAYGMLAVMLPTLEQAVRTHGWLLLTIGIVSLIYGALAAFAQRDFKRLIAYTSINHMGYVMVAVAVAGLTTSVSIKQLALGGAGIQAISHGLLTGAMFFLVGIIEARTETRQMPQLGGLLKPMPVYSGLLGIFAFASLGLPGFSGFIAELQVIAATLSVTTLGAVCIVIGLIVMTGVYIRIIVQMIMGETGAAVAGARDVGRRETSLVVPLAALSLLIGILPSVIVPLMRQAGEALLTTAFTP